jgi:DNA-binding XRE family transcriptional regulator
MGISPAQCRAARALLGWTQQETADNAPRKIDKKTIVNLENGIVEPYDRTVDDIEKAFTNAGVVFFPSSLGECQDIVALKAGMDDPKLKKREADAAARGNEQSKAKDALINHWKERSGLWGELSDDGRQAIMSRMGVADEVEIFGAAE